MNLMSTVIPSYLSRHPLVQVAKPQLEPSLLFRTVNVLHHKTTTSERKQPASFERCKIHRCLLIHRIFNHLNAELNPICHLLALLGAHHILHVNRIRVNDAVLNCRFYVYHRIRGDSFYILIWAWDSRCNYCFQDISRIVYVSTRV
jgi:hypothetical protein